MKKEEKKYMIKNMIEIITTNVQLLYLLYQASRGFYKNTDNKTQQELNILKDKIKTNQEFQNSYGFKLIVLQENCCTFNELKHLTKVAIKFQKFVEKQFGHSPYDFSTKICDNFVEMINSILEHDKHMRIAREKIYTLLDKEYSYFHGDNEIYDTMAHMLFGEDLLTLEKVLVLAPKLQKYKRKLSTLISKFNPYLEKYNNCYNKFIAISGYDNSAYAPDIDTELNIDFIDFIQGDVMKMFDFANSKPNKFSLNLEEFIEKMRFILKNKIIQQNNS